MELHFHSPTSLHDKFFITYMDECTFVYLEHCLILTVYHQRIQIFRDVTFSYTILLPKNTSFLPRFSDSFITSANFGCRIGLQIRAVDENLSTEQRRRGKKAWSLDLWAG